VSRWGWLLQQARSDLLRIAMRDCIHQPYRAAICPLLTRLLPLAGEHGILGAALSGAGPSGVGNRSNEERVPEATAAIQGALEA